MSKSICHKGKHSLFKLDLETCVNLSYFSESSSADTQENKFARSILQNKTGNSFETEDEDDNADDEISKLEYEAVEAVNKAAQAVTGKGD